MVKSGTAEKSQNMFPPPAAVGWIFYVLDDRVALKKYFS